MDGYCGANPGTCCAFGVAVPDLEIVVLCKPQVRLERSEAKGRVRAWGWLGEFGRLLGDFVWGKSKDVFFGGFWKKIVLVYRDAHFLRIRFGLVVDFEERNDSTVLNVQIPILIRWFCFWFPPKTNLKGVP